MRILGNILWLILGGLVFFLGWVILGVLLCITIIGIPFGIQCFKAASINLAPFGKVVETNFEKHPVANVLWVVLVGWELALGHLISGVLCCITIIGIPFGLQSFKFMKLALLPFGATVKKVKKK